MSQQEKLTQYLSLLQEKRDYKLNSNGIKEPVKTKRRPIIIELSGLPKSGKSTCIEAVKKLLSSHGFKVRIIGEKAALCSLSKFDISFNLWTYTNFINELNEALQMNEQFVDSEKDDVILCDRGVFDALVWFTWHYKKKSILPSEYNNIKNIVLWERMNRVHSVIVLKCKPEDALLREPAHSLININHSIMKKTVLSRLNDCIEFVKKDFRKTNTSIFEIDSVYNNEDTLKFDVAYKVLECMDEYYDEKIAYITKDELHFQLEKGVLPAKQVRKIEQMELKYDARSKVEGDSGLLQIIPVALIAYKDKTTHKTKVLCVRKNANSIERENNRAPELQKDLFYVGGHIRTSDKGATTVKTMVNALRREIFEELGLSVAISDKVKFKMVYYDDNAKSAKHLAAYIVIYIDYDNVEIKLDGTELVQKRGSTNSGKFFDVSNMPKSLVLESWSKEILTNEFGDVLNKDFIEYCIQMKTFLELFSDIDGKN
ncbi:MAG: hypothetical protein J1G01_05770 [Clostridiales bacterium]|nr:hypothetical protein [Clostridiales bacterium]